jgi:hypothetical protein
LSRELVIPATRDLHDDLKLPFTLSRAKSPFILSNHSILNVFCRFDSVVNVEGFSFLDRELQRAREEMPDVSAGTDDTAAGGDFAETLAGTVAATERVLSLLLCRGLPSILRRGASDQFQSV